MIPSKPYSINQWLLIILSTLILLMGIVVIVGWYNHNALIVQLHPSLVPMQFNTALLFILTGISLILLELKQPARYLGFIIIVVSVFTLLEYLFVTDLLIDQLFHKSFLTVKTSHPGRMAPNTAICFLLSGCFIFIVGSRHHLSLLYSAMATAILIFVIGAIALFGYAVNIESTYAWGPLTQMALHTAAGFTLVGFIVISQAFKALSTYLNNQTQYWFSVLPGSIVFCFFLLLADALTTEHFKNIDQIVTTRTHAVVELIQDNLKLRMDALDRMSQRWAKNKGTNYNHWQADTHHYLEDMPGFQAIEWVDVDYVVRWILPEKSNEKAQNLDLSLESNRLEALIRAKNSRYPTISHSIELVQGGRGFLIYCPIWNENTFFGFILGVVNVELWINTVLKDPDKISINFQFHDQGKLLFKTQELPASLAHFFQIESEMTKGVNWQLNVWPKTILLQQNKTFVPLLTLISGMILAILLSVIVYIYQYTVSNNARLKSILDSTSDGVVVFDQGGQINVFNREAEKIFGYDSSDMIGDHIKRLMPALYQSKSNAVINRYLGMFLPKIMGQYNETRTLNQHGILFPIEYAVNKVLKISNQYICIVRDVTEKKSDYEILLRSQKMEAIGQLSSRISHDLNNLLGIILGNLELLNRIVDQKLVPKYIEPALKSVKRGINLSKSLLNVSRLRRNRKAHVVLNDLITNMEALIKLTVSANIQIQYNLATDLKQCEIDAGEFIDSLLNLTVNANDAMDNVGDIIISTENIYSTIKGVRFSIRDTGVGIDPAIISRIFDPFFTTKALNKGSGLGLNQVYRFVKSSAGDIKVASKPDQGTIIIIDFPQSVSEDQPQKTAENKQVIGGHETILIVDDEKALTEIAKEYLENIGYVTYVAYSRIEALALLADKNLHIDLLFTDVVMATDNDGFELTKQAVNLRPNIKVLLTSGYYKDNRLMLYPLSPEILPYEANMLIKPYDFSQLANSVRYVLDSPELIKWHPDMNVGIDIIDKDHQAMVNILNLLKVKQESDADVLQIQFIVNKLMAYTQYHFCREEALMKACHYPDYAQHLKIHQKLIRQIQGISDKLEMQDADASIHELSLFLTNWLLDHICHTDKQYVDSLCTHPDLMASANQEYENKTQLTY